MANRVTMTICGMEYTLVAEEDAAYLHGAPHRCPIGRPDEVKAARNPVLRYEFPDNRS